RPFWDKAFIGGSVVATFFQGVTLGAYLEGIDVVGRQFAGGPFDWFRPFPLFTGLGLIVAYAMLGCTWLIMKTDSRLQERMMALARPLALVLLAVIAIVSLWTPIAHEAIRQRWFSTPNLYWFAPVPVLVLVCTWSLLRSLEGRPQGGPFVLTLCLVFLGYSGLGISLWPNIIPPNSHLWEAAGPPPSQGFALVGALFIIPSFLVYTGWSYYVFRGKVRAGYGYH